MCSWCSVERLSMNILLQFHYHQLQGILNHLPAWERGVDDFDTPIYYHPGLGSV